MGNQYFVEQFTDQNLDSRQNLEADHNLSFMAYQSQERGNQAIEFKAMKLHQNPGNLHLRLIEAERNLDIQLQVDGLQLQELLP